MVQFVVFGEISSRGQAKYVDGGVRRYHGPPVATLARSISVTHDCVGATIGANKVGAAIGANKVGGAVGGT